MLSNSLKKAAREEKKVTVDDERAVAEALGEDLATALTKLVFLHDTRGAPVKYAADALELLNKLQINNPTFSRETQMHICHLKLRLEIFLEKYTPDNLLKAFNSLLKLVENLESASTGSDLNQSAFMIFKRDGIVKHARNSAELGSITYPKLDLGVNFYRTAREIEFYAFSILRRAGITVKEVP